MRNGFVGVFRSLSVGSASRATRRQEGEVQRVERRLLLPEIVRDVLAPRLHVTGRPTGQVLRANLVVGLIVAAITLAACDLDGGELRATATPEPTLEAAVAPSPGPTPTASPVPASSSPTPAPTATTTGATSILTLDLTVAPTSASFPDYDRGDWSHWRDADKDCQDGRQEVLIAESTVPVAFKSTAQCRVASGRWVGPYTGTVVEDPSKLDVDHMVPLANAHRSGGWAWNRERKSAYANDLKYEHHLIATTRGANRSKGSKGPEDWRPPAEGYWCQYATNWTTIKDQWELTATERELQALQEMLKTCVQPVEIEITYR